MAHLVQWFAKKKIGVSNSKEGITKPQNLVISGVKLTNHFKVWLYPGNKQRGFLGKFCQILCDLDQQGKQ